MRTKLSVTVIIPAFNEEKNIAASIAFVHRALVPVVSNYEIIVVDDGSTDKTGVAIAACTRKDPRVRTIHHVHNVGFGLSFCDGIGKATKKYVTGFPGDGDISWITLRTLVEERESADIISSYMANAKKRTYLRRICSWLFVHLMNLLFGTSLKYYNGYFICETKLLKQIHLKSHGFSLFAEIKVRLMAKGATIKEIPFNHRYNRFSESKAITPKSIWQITRDIATLYSDIHWQKSR